MTRKQKGTENLRSASDHLFYEMWMLHSVSRGLASGVFGEGPITNALLESFTIHARGLLHFFYPLNAQDDDVLASHFFPSPDDWNRARPGEPEALQNVRKRVGKEVAHLTYARLKVTPEAKPWPYIEIAQAFDAVIKCFLELVPKELLGPRWGGYVSTQEPTSDRGNTR